MEACEHPKSVGKNKVKKPKNKKKEIVQGLTMAGEVIANDLVTVKNPTKAKVEKIKELNKTKTFNENSTKQKMPELDVKTTQQDEGLSPKDLAKIEKKNAKKLKQKLKKAAKKAKLEKPRDGKPNTLKKVGMKIKTQAKSKETVTLETATAEQESNPPSQPNTDLTKSEKVKKQKDSHDATLKEKTKVRADEGVTVFVGNLPVNTKRIQLIKLFKDYGPVKSVRFRTAAGHVLLKHKQRKEAGTLNAYVVLKDAETVERALALNGTEFKSNHLRVTKASTRASNTDAKHLVFVGNLKNSGNEEQLREIFSSCGEIDYIRCIRDAKKGCKGVAYVCYKNPESVGLALELNETLLDERPIHVERYSVRKLGAKQARDSAAQSTSKYITGARKRLELKKKKQEKQKEPAPPKNESDKKKSKYHGVKVNGIKKKQKKGSKPSKGLVQLAKKIAPH